MLLRFSTFVYQGQGQRRLESILEFGISVVKIMFIVIGVDRLAAHVLIDGLKVYYHVHPGLPLPKCE